jgi:hypothetical protein
MIERSLYLQTSFELLGIHEQKYNYYTIIYSLSI